MMKRKHFAACLLTATLWTAFACAGTPVFISGLKDASIREMDLLYMTVLATDTAPLEYVWTITFDETNGQAFFRNASHTFAELGVRWISPAGAGLLGGKRVGLKVVARHANPLVDGPEEAESTATFTIQGVNHPPVPVISGKLGTPTDRIPTGNGVCADGYQSTDPDGDTVRGNWGWGARTGGHWITPLGDLWPALFGSEGGRCCFTVIDMTAPIDQQIELTLLNGLHEVKAVATCYLKPASVVANQAPIARIQYLVGEGSYTGASAQTVIVDTSAAVTLSLKADASSDDGGASNLGYTWTEEDSAGGLAVSSATGAATTVQVPAHTTGTLDVTLTAKDLANLTDTATISFEFIDYSAKPTARATPKIGSQLLAGPVTAGTVVALDGSASSRQDGSTASLGYQWTQIEGPTVVITNANQAVAQFTAPAASDGPTWLKFKLVVNDGLIVSDPLELAVDVSGSSFYFSQVAVGPLGTSEFTTTLLLVNGTSEIASGVDVKFFGQDGKAMPVTINGSPWDGQPFDIPPQSSERLVFAGQALQAGWARVKTNTKLAGLLLYQIVGQEGDLQTQVGLYSTEAARKFATFYDPALETAIAVANPSGQAAVVRVRIVDNKTGAEVINKLLFPEEPNGSLPSLQHRAQFLTLDFLGQLPAGFSAGTLIVESDVPTTVTILQTKGGVVFSTLPVRTLW